MGRDAIKAAENPCFRCRREAAKYNDRLYSREGAAELLGVSVSSLADYELGITKVIPVDKVVLMAELYNAPELKIWYCSHECPIGRGLPMPSDSLSTVERTTLRLLRSLKDSSVDDVRETLIDITADGKISADEKVELVEVMEYLNELIIAAGELKLIGSKILGGNSNDDRTGNQRVP